MAKRIEIIGLEGIPEVRIGEDLTRLIIEALGRQGERLQDKDIVIITQRIVSKAEGRVVRLSDVLPSPFARQIAALYDKDARQVELVLRESKRIVRMDRGIIIAETRHGFICANAGVDTSNTGEDLASLLPEDPDASAERVRQRLKERLGVDVAVIITDTFGRPWREGITNVAIGAAGIAPLLSYLGQTDPYGYTLKATVVAVIDELAAAAELVMGKVERIPVAVIRGYDYAEGCEGAKALVREPEKDMFR